MISVFKTSVKYKKDIIRIKKSFKSSKDFIIHFDLEDCDKILRVEGDSYIIDEVIQKVQALGFNCEELK